jgi:hypothetical protein
MILKNDRYYWQEKELQAGRSEAFVNQAAGVEAQIGHIRNQLYRQSAAKSVISLTNFGAQPGTDRPD